jgi:hypothetical protein
LAGIDAGISKEGRAAGGTGVTTGAAAFVAIVAVITLARLIGQHFSVVDLDVDEAQYWDWSRELAFGYFSKPPLIAWLNAASGLVCGDSIACIRAPAPLLYAGTALLVYLTARELYGSTVAFWAGVVLLVAPGVDYSSRIMTTDVPLLFFWALALLAYVKLMRSTRGGWGWAGVLAVAFGLGLLAKYAMAYFVAGIVVAAIFSRDARALLKDLRLWAGLAGGLVIFLPNVIWNLNNGLVTAHATADYVAPSDGPFLDLDDTLNFIAAQFAVTGPVVFATLLVLFARFFSRNLTANDRTMLAFAAPPLVVVIFSGLYSGNAYANWAATAMISAVIVASTVLVRGGWWRALTTTVVLGLIAQTGLLLADPFADRISLRALGRNGDVYRPVLGWRELSERVAALVAASGAASVAADERPEVATLSYYRRGDARPVLIWTGNAQPTNHFELTRPLTAASPGPILFLSPCPSGDPYRRDFQTVTDLGAFSVPTGPTSRREYHAFLLAGPRGPIAPLGPCG